MVTLDLWQKIALYALVLGSLFVYVKLSNLKINGMPFLRLEYRILIAALFPLVLIVAFIAGTAILAAALAVFAIITLYSFITKKKIKIKIPGMKPRQPLS